MDYQEIIEKIRKHGLNQPEATVLAASIIVEAIDRQIKVQKAALKMQIEMSGLAGDMMKKLANSIDSVDEGDSWKNGSDDMP